MPLGISPTSAHFCLLFNHSLLFNKTTQETAPYACLLSYCQALSSPFHQDFTLPKSNV